MSAVLGVNATKIAAMSPSNTLDEGQSAGKVRVMFDQYECAALAAASTITIGKTLPAGARIVEIVLSSDNLANNTTLAVGDSDTAARYISATDHGAAATTTRLNVADGLNYKIGTADGDDQILITTAAGAATGTINIAVLYTFE